MWKSPTTLKAYMKPTEAEVQLLTKWVEALESGKYQQGRNRLRNFDRFCCVGVLCDVVDPTKWVYLGDWGVDVWDGEDGSVHPSVLQLLPVIENWSELYYRNDGQKQTFPEISAYLREKYLT